MKIAVLGAGAMGSLYGAKLSRTQDVTMVDVNETLIDHINQNGIVMQEADGTEETYNLKAVKSGTDIGVQDLVIAFVKGIFTKDTIRQNLSMIGSNTLVMTLQNGAGNNRDIAKFVSKDNILVGTTSQLHIPDLSYRQLLTLWVLQAVCHHKCLLQSCHDNK